MNTLRIILVILLPLAMTWVTFRKRHLMLIDPCRASFRQRARGGGLVLLLMFSMAPAWYELMMGPWGRSYWFDRSPLLILAAYIIEVLLYRHLAEAWKRSLLFFGAMQVPICGCILTILIWLHDRQKRGKELQRADAPVEPSGPESMRRMILRRRRRLAQLVTLRIGQCLATVSAQIVTLRKTACQ